MLSSEVGRSLPIFLTTSADLEGVSGCRRRSVDASGCDGHDQPVAKDAEDDDDDVDGNNSGA